MTTLKKEPPYTDIELMLFEHFKAKGFEIKGSNKQKFKVILRKHSDRINSNKIDKSEGLLDVSTEVRKLDLNQVADLYLVRAAETLGFNLANEKPVKLTDAGRQTFAKMINKFDDKKRTFERTHPEIFSTDLMTDLELN